MGNKSKKPKKVDPKLLAEAQKLARKKSCEAQTEFCSGEMLQMYGVNGSEKEGTTFLICGACVAMLRRRGAKFKMV